MAPHSSALAWRTPGTAGPGGLPSMGSHRLGHDCNDFAAAAAAAAAASVHRYQKGLEQSGRITQVTVKQQRLGKKKIRIHFLINFNWKDLCLNGQICFAYLMTITNLYE